MSDDIVVFVGFTRLSYLNSNNSNEIPVGIYASINGSLFKLVDLTSRINGKNIPDFSSTSLALQGHYLTFTATFGDGTKAILQADLNAH